MSVGFSKAWSRVTPHVGLPERLLRGWTDVCWDYKRRVGDLPWQHKERAQVGFLAAAAWRLKGAALEEWMADKFSHDGARRNGRGDLWIQLGARAWHIEAKHVTVRLHSDSARGVAQVRATFRRACHDASAMHAYRGERRVGIVFAAPVIARKHVDQASDRLGRWLEDLRKIPSIGMAYCMDNRQLAARGNADIWPGAVLLVGKSRKAG